MAAPESPLSPAPPGPSAPKPGPREPLQPRLLMLFLAGWLLFNFPLLGLLLAPGSGWGLPLAPLWMFGAWAALIGLLAWWMESADPDH